MGSKTQAVLELCDVLVYRVERAEDAAETVAAALDIPFNAISRRRFYYRSG
jgi:hypothetical protein